MELIKDIDDMEYEGESIKLGGKVRHLKYTIKGLKILARKFGSVQAAFSSMQNMNTDFDLEGIDSVVLLLYAGLIHEDADLTIDTLENLVTVDNMTEAFNVIIRAYTGSIPTPKEGDSAGPGETKA